MSKSKILTRKQWLKYLEQFEQPPNVIVVRGKRGKRGMPGERGWPGPPGPTGAMGATGLPGPGHSAEKIAVLHAELLELHRRMDQFDECIRALVEQLNNHKHQDKP